MRAAVALAVAVVVGLLFVMFGNYDSDKNSFFPHNNLIVGCHAQQQQQQEPRIVADEDGHLRMQAAPNKTLWFNEVDLISMISQQQQQLETQLSINADLESTVNTLNSTLSQLPCRAFNPLSYDAAAYNNNVSVLAQGVHVDYESSNLYVGGPGNNKWRTGILASNGLVYGAPSFSSTVLLINPATSVVDTTSIAVTNPTTFTWFGVVEGANNNKLYFLPLNTDHVLIVDPNDNNAVDQTSITGLGTDGAKWIGGVTATNNNKIYCTPYNSQSVLIIDPSDDTADTTTISGLPSTQLKWTGAILANSGLIYSVPRDYNFVLIINPMTDTADYTSVAVESGVNKWVDGVLANNGKIYGMPSTMSKVLVIDPTNNNAVSYIDVTLPAAGGNWFGGVLTGNGKVVGIPFYADTILIIDPETDTVDSSSLQVPASTDKWFGGVYVSQHNRIYGIPQNHDHVLLIDLDPCV